MWYGERGENGQVYVLMGTGERRTKGVEEYQYRRVPNMPPVAVDAANIVFGAAIDITPMEKNSWYSTLWIALPILSESSERGLEHSRHPAP